MLSARPRPVFCVNEHEHRDRALADAVASGRFTFNGETRTLGLEPDWLDAPLPNDEEWRLDWVKFYYGLDLADAFRASGDARYLHAWERLVASYILQVQPGHDDSEVTARRVLNWIYAWQRLPEADAGVAHALYESLGAQARHVRANLSPERNHRTLELYALLIVALALPGLGIEPPLAELHENLLTDFGPDGVHRERSTHYHCIALRSFVGARENCRRFGVPLPAGFDERLALACAFARDCRRPDGTIPALSDADTGDYTALLRLAGRLLAREDLLEPQAGAYPDGGYFIQRTRDRYLIFDCGPLGDGGHGHYDALSLEAWAHGRPLVLDPGRYTYAEGKPNWRHWFRGTAAHNTVCVDGFDQTPYTRSRSSLPSAQATFLGGDETTLAGEVRSPCYEAVHRRRVTLTDGRWVIEDELEGAHRHRYDLRWHLPPGPAHLRADGVVTPEAELTISGARSVALEDGWISPEYGIKQAAKVVSAVAVGKRARFVTVLEPRARA
ncbi:alginate lyase family protein [Solirubrobacter deserti]|uniref:Heparinase II/III family protein n=1 Tax=Solirubrobacter deserti TaxID=2282478 RepID=A0ABT4RPI9_9ACTN|nr:alginate lyase family protein [Solirubrobacter deserti]MDA0140484.1 heparinase II/III family protein [Solirubrobacter deserti]